MPWVGNGSDGLQRLTQVDFVLRDEPLSRLDVTTGDLVVSVDPAGDQSGRRIGSKRELLGNNDLGNANNLRNIVVAVPNLKVELRGRFTP